MQDAGYRIQVEESCLADIQDSGFKIQDTLNWEEENSIK
jgi:hypothetical protein